MVLSLVAIAGLILAHGKKGIATAASLFLVIFVFWWAPVQFGVGMKFANRIPKTLKEVVTDYDKRARGKLRKIEEPKDPRAWEIAGA